MFLCVDKLNNCAFGATLTEAYENYLKEVDYDNENLTFYSAEEIPVKVEIRPISVKSTKKVK
jgi:hypothetical protein